MSNLMQDAVDWLGAQLKRAAGVTITYTRGTNSVSITATPTLHEYEIVSEEGFGLRVLSRDYWITAADLVLNGATIEPRTGDRITETIGGVSETFEVMPLEQRHEKEPADTNNTMLIVHTKKVA